MLRVLFSFWVVLTALLMLGLQAWSLRAPIVGEHDWRQADTYAVAKNFHTISPNFFYPRNDRTQGRTGIKGMEAPVAPYFVALAMPIFGTEPPTGRLVIWTIWTIGLAMAVAFVFRALGFATGLAFLLIVSTSPALLFTGRQIQPDAPALGFLLASLALLALSLSRASTVFEALALLAFVLSVVMRPGGFVALPTLLLIRARDPRPGRWVRLAAWVMIPIAAYAAWYSWATFLDDHFDNGERYFHTGLGLQEIRQNLFDLEGWRFVFGFLLPNYALAWTFFPAVLVGLLRGFGREERRFSIPALTWLLLGFVLMALLSRRLIYHWYYVLPLAPPLAYFGAVGLGSLFGPWSSGPVVGARDRLVAFALGLGLLASLWLGGAWDVGSSAISASGPPMGRTWMSTGGLLTGLGIGGLSFLISRRPLPRLGPLLPLVASLGLFAATARGGYDSAQVFLHRIDRNGWQSFEQRFGALREAVGRFSCPGDPIVVNHPSPWRLHLAERRGSALVEGEILQRGWESFRAEGTRLFLRYEDGAFERIDAGPLLAEGPGWRLHCITDRCEPLTCGEAPEHAPQTGESIR